MEEHRRSGLKAFEKILYGNDERLIIRYHFLILALRINVFSDNCETKEEGFCDSRFDWMFDVFLFPSDYREMEFGKGGSGIDGKIINFFFPILVFYIGYVDVRLFDTSFRR